MRTKTKKSGSKAIPAALILLTLGGLAARDKKAAEPYSIVGGTVFHEPGLALPGAEVTITPKLADGSQLKLRITRAISDERGEFAFRVPPTAAAYKVRASAKGFQAEEKTAEVTGEGERVDVTFLLETESKR
ncbi:MAG: carboxypeptidase-like regulatory domain-containing protein [Bryobacteraceae bacterium]|jgi:hypothetical protein